MRYFLGVDIGNSKSHALIADENGRCLGFGQAGPGSWEAIGWKAAGKVLHQIVEQALAQAKVEKTAVAAAGFGYAGYDWPEDRPGHIALIESLGLANARYALGNDTLIGLVAGAKDGWGVVVVAGTSNNCLGRDRQGREGRMVGSSRFGEYGGAAEIVARAIQAVAAAWTQRGPGTMLREAFMEKTGATDVADLLAGLMRHRYELSAAAAPLVFAVAAQGDEVAQGIITWAGQELGSLAVGVIRQLDLSREAFDVVLSGSVYQGGDPLIEPMRQTILAAAPKASLIRLQAPPVMGGVLLAMEQVGLDTAVCRQTLLHATLAFIPAT